jgi:hypothetical protein
MMNARPAELTPARPCACPHHCSNTSATAYGPDALRADLDRLTFLLGGSDGEDLFGRP